MLVSDIGSPIEKGYEALMHGKQAKVATYFHFAFHSYKVYRDLKHMDMVRTPQESHGNFTWSPYELMDGLCVTSFLNVTTNRNCIIKYFRSMHLRLGGNHLSQWFEEYET